jgi:uncharacterized membrane protein YbhN (UPF0104 family)
MNSKRIKFFFKLTGTIVFLLYLQWKIDLKAVGAAFYDVRISLYFFSLLLMFLNSLVLAQKYRVIMVPSGIRQPLWKLFRINLICRYYSTFLTAPVGQGIVRWHLTTEGREGRSKFIAVMVVERAGFLFALLTLAATAMLLLDSPMLRAFHAPAFPWVSILIVLTITFHAFFVFPRLHGHLVNGLLRLTKRSRPWLQQGMRHATDLLSVFVGQQRVLGLGILLSLLWQAVFLFRVHLLAESMSLPFGFFDMAWMASLVLLFQILPISFNGIGLRESAYAYLFSLQGISPEKGVMIGLLLLSQVMVLSLFGALLHWGSRSEDNNP